MNIPPLNPSLRVLVVADDPLARTGLATLITDHSDYTVTGQINSGSDLAGNTGIYSPDVMVWDMGWEPSGSIELLADLGNVGAPVAALLADESFAADAWLAGAQGLFLRNIKIELLVAGLPAVAQTLITLDPAIGKAMLSPRERAITPPSEDLTSRELQVLQFLAQGLANKAIAQQLKISESTVKFHVNAIMGKLGAQSRTDAVVRATRLGLIIL